MSVTLRLAGPDDLERLERMVAACHEETGIASDAESRRAAIAPVLDGAPQGAIYLVGPPRSPVGYLALGFGWSLSGGGLEARIDEFYIRGPVRRRGMGGEALLALMPVLGRHGVARITAALPDPDHPAARLCRRLRFEMSGGEFASRAL